MMTHDDRAAYIRAIIRHRAPEVVLGVVPVPSDDPEAVRAEVA